ncbi:unnamed protein product [marine sediment metagenome]|uniref:Amidohydrolase-related domain-containing protein n=1 Tax=marine sediment metagenome TaxID=412755 RepID=X1LYM7_9ZZZZ
MIIDFHTHIFPPWIKEKRDEYLKRDSCFSLLYSQPKAEKIKNKPPVIIARTIKGKGVSFMENKVKFHGKAPTPEEAERALKELE